MTAQKGYKCRFCRQAQTSHREAPIGDVFLCEDGQVGVFEKVVPTPDRHPQSFGEGEVGLLADIFDSLHGEDVDRSRAFALHPSMAKLARKVFGMKAKVKHA